MGWSCAHHRPMSIESGTTDFQEGQQDKRPEFLAQWQAMQTN